MNKRFMAAGALVAAAVLFGPVACTDENGTGDGPPPPPAEFDRVVLGELVTSVN
jgi:hypothetical protein